jgi:hypothetical protein
MKLHVICERDVGLFSLIQQVVSNISWALTEQRVPVVYFGDRCCYWTPGGYHGRDTVWEYYFEPLVPDYPAAAIVDSMRNAIDQAFPGAYEVGY